MMSQGLITMSYITASVLFILSLSGLSNQETARRGNYYGMAGMAIAIIATILSDAVNAYVVLVIALIIGGGIGAMAALKVEMTQMPELVALMHSLVGMAAVLVGYANFIDTSDLTGIEKKYTTRLTIAILTHKLVSMIMLILCIPLLAKVFDFVYNLCLTNGGVSCCQRF